MGPTASLLLAYAAGCISFAGLAARLAGVDIRSVGSGNPGATNVGRVLGRRWGRAVLLLDVAKGLLPVLLLRAPPAALLAGWAPPGWLVDPEGRVLVAAAAVAGHVFPVTSRFRGGKGVATYLGGVLALDWLLALAAVLVHVLLKKRFGFVSLASMGLVWTFPALQLLLPALGGAGRFTAGAGVVAALAALITIRHRDNLARIRTGREDRYDGSRAVHGGHDGAGQPGTTGQPRKDG